MTPQPELARRIEARTQALAFESVQPFHQDPFWYARYGEARTRKFGDEDAVFHVRYLVQALAQGAPSVMEGYARWLRTLLVSHGMCTRHLAQHFAWLQEALARGGLSTPEVRTVLASAHEALVHREGSAGTLASQADALSQRAARALGQAGSTPLQAELGLQLCYLADALALKRPELFVQHARFYAGFWPRRAQALPGTLTYPQVLRALQDALDTLPPAPLAEARPLLAQALDAVQRTP
ncbi:hypothetical protein FGE12_22845 [Aggregicoccus sp. 17bor-14]|uniref:hypothetical protein n=1 Tax=Myxococcaceae TaxID=31 RepID=UPI00129D01E3|nr:MULTISPECIES: hypothetical protein [Myxococcaceae]MBF5045261.1 hypothetical protein [Simulacricoccus sp. 17bor-14]MRI91002.1 hypothetical protein [Aggregicoccus sp. 17bor-14]